MIVFLDTNVVIYAVEVPPLLGKRANDHLSALRARGDTFLLSDLVRLECLVGPLRAGNAALESAFRAFFTFTGTTVVPVTPAVCDRAAVIRATTSFKALDALRLAAAVEHGATVFLTNDTRLHGFSGLAVEVLP